MAVKTYTKGQKVQLSKNFASTEFDCHGNGCCSSTKVDSKLVDYLQQIRNHFGKAVSINSGYRCAKHNASVGGASRSNHMDGEAADIRISGVTPIEVARYAESIGILGIGVYSWGVHIDTRTSKYFWYDGGESNVKTFGGAPAKKPEPTKPVETKELYRVRKTWANASSQIGAYSILANAKAACDKAGTGYGVFNSKGEKIYPEDKPTIDTPPVNTAAINDKVMWDYFKSQGLNDYGIAGLMGNLYAESGFKPTNLQNTYEKKLGMTDAEYTAAVDNDTYTNFVRDSAGYGIAQWTYWSLKQDLLNYVKQKNKSIGDGQIQMEFLAYQLSKDFAAVWKTLKNATSILEASNAVLLKFERPADQSTTVQNKRAELGKVYYDKYASKTVVTPQPNKPSEGYTNSPLVDYVKISPNKTSPRNHKIDTITIHCVVGQCSVETLGNVFAPTSRQASSNYGIGYDGKIGMYVEEKDRSWCSSSSANDNRAITIEVASDTEHPYAVNDKAYAALIELLVDICKRNDIKELKWKGDKSLIGQVDKQNMTVHRWFANKSCPGDFLYERHGAIADAVNKKLGVTTTTPSVPTIEETTKFPYLVKINTAILNVRAGAGTNYKVNTQVKKNQVYTIVDEKDGWGKLKSGAGWISLQYTIAV